MVILIIFADYFGRKKTLIFIAVNSLVAYTVLYFSKNVWHVFVSQWLQGTTQGAITTVILMSITEYTSPINRGIFVSVNAATFYGGIWMANALGIFFHYSYIGLVGAVLSFCVVVSIMSLPESPLWLACKGNYEASAAAHRWLKGKDQESERELSDIIKHQEALSQSKKDKTSIICYIKHYAKVIRQPEFYKPLLLCSLACCMYNFSGKLVCAVYAVEMMKKITSSSTEAFAAVLILDGFSVAGTYVGCVIAKFFNRRTMLIVPSMLCVIFSVLTSLYIYLVKLSVISENVYVSCALLIAYSLAACCGPIIIAATVAADLYPVKNRSFSVCVICIVANLIFGTLLKLSPLLFQALEMHGTFLFFGVSLSIFLYFTYKYLPETKDKTIHEISEYFISKKVYAATELNLLESVKTKEHTT